MESGESLQVSGRLLGITSINVGILRQRFLDIAHVVSGLIATLSCTDEAHGLAHARLKKRKKRAFCQKSVYGHFIGSI
jgi:hypothetical protein